MRKESKQRFYAVALIILMILTPYFLFQTNFLYEITNHESWSVPLSEYRMGIRPYTEFNYVNAPDVLGSRWLNSNFDSSSTVLYADSASVYNVLTSYGMVPRDIDQNTRILWNKTNYEPLALVFLSKINLESGYFAFGNSHFNSSQIMPVLGSYDILYNNGQTIIGYKAENIS
jgi:hypothetical protein